ncbi:Hypothetical predicted protein [Marmota monax]|uniref:Uncharacterized protein n=1 Tax=Marmota monax TaxID=9995 RepID=A0A5E4A3B4_MARMO|nr:Hypothetical predicted protein [Marmota monax]
MKVPIRMDLALVSQWLLGWTQARPPMAGHLARGSLQSPIFSGRHPGLREPLQISPQGRAQLLSDPWGQKMDRRQRQEPACKTETQWAVAVGQGGGGRRPGQPLAAGTCPSPTALLAGRQKRFLLGNLQAHDQPPSSRQVPQAGAAARGQEAQTHTSR